MTAAEGNVFLEPKAEFGSEDDSASEPQCVIQRFKIFVLAKQQIHPICSIASAGSDHTDLSVFSFPLQLNRR